MGIIIAIAAVLIAFILIAIAAKKNPQDDSSRPPRENYVDAQNLPPYFSREQCEEIEKIANFYGVRYVTGTETRNWILHNLKELFSSMPGWDIWDSSIHEADGQFERAERGGVNKDIYILCYDSKYKLAKIQGKTGIYLTSCNRCSCPDFRKRRLPCKHMYMLAYELGGNIEKDITDDHHAPLYGLQLALAGHLPKSSKGVGGIRADISDRGGTWSDDIDEFESSAVVVGSNPSIRRLERIKSFDLEVLTAESIGDVFTAHTVPS